jgi:hypothetical protein
VAGVAVAARLAAPLVVERYVNRALAEMGEYHGSVTGIDLSLVRGGYVLRNLEIVKNDATPETPPFATIPTMDLTLQWRALFKGSAVGQVIMHEPQLNLVQSEADQEKQLGTGVSWPHEIRDLFPFTLNIVEARNGLVTLRAPGISNNDSLTVRDFNMQLLNLTNVQDLEEPAFADLDVRGYIMGNAPIALTGSIDPNERAFVAAFSHSLEGSINLRDVASDVRCLGDPPAEAQPDEERSRRERRRDRC